ALDAFIARHGLPAPDAPMPTGPALEREFDALERALAELDREDRRNAHLLAQLGPQLGAQLGTGFPARRGRKARLQDATLPCLGTAASGHAREQAQR
ncbi:MAG TPA: hypothetical protein VK943_18095, partial [Arenibaculum sp.]|nr:hypothetical protein [Arenibaculum sp.]